MPSGTPPTLADVAERAGVSRQTVSNAVNNPDLLRADTLARVQEAIDDLGYSPNRAARNLRTRASHLIGLRIEPGAGGHRQRHDGPVRALPRRDLARGRLPRAALRRRRADDPLGGYDDLLRSTAVDAFVVTDTYLGNPQAAWLRERRAPFVAFGRPWDDPERPAPVGRRRRRRRHRAGHRPPARQGPPADRVDRLAQGLLHRRGPTRGLEPGACAARGLATTGLASRVEDTVAQRARGQRRTPRRGAAHGVRLRLRHPGDGRAAHPAPTAGCAPGRDIAVVGFDDSQVAQVVPPGLTSVRQPLEDVAVEIVRALEGLLAPPAASGAGRARSPRPLVPIRGIADPSPAQIRRLRPHVDGVVDLERPRGARGSPPRPSRRRTRSARPPRGPRATRTASPCRPGSGSSRASTRTARSSAGSTIG